ncbi:ABC transporter substrate-binding protein [Leifsonia sp. NPDC058230]|uniref:ABC transporter substrate-binding protein n=1 Tax=Leifsonia sp. NPDC058230 TaxID=3346391 RepID=UPI0036DA5B7F
MKVPVSRRAFLGAGLSTAAFATLALAGCAPATTSVAANGTIRYQFFTGSALKDVGSVETAINALLKKRGKKFTVKLEPLDSTTYRQRMPLDLAAGTAADVFFTAPWLNDYYKNVSDGNLLALDSLLSKSAPTLKSTMSESWWNAVRVNGKVYGVINQQLFPKTWGFVAKGDLAEKYGLDASKITRYDQLGPFLADVKKGEPDVTPLYSEVSGSTFFRSEIYGWDGSLETYGLAVKADDKNLKVFNMFETDEFKETCELMRKWARAGYTATTAPSGTDANSAWANGKIALQFNQVNRGTPWPFDVVQKTLVDPLTLSTASVNATMTGINAASKNPQAAIEWIELLNTDKELYNLICFGIEGKHWEFIDKSKGVVGFPAGVTASTSPYNPNEDWAFGNQFNAYYRTREAADAQLWKQQEGQNSSAAISTLMGFNLDTTSLKTQIATVTAAIGQYKPQSVLGQVDPATGVPNMVNQLKAAGIDAIQKEAQKQIDAWKKNS